MLQQAERNTSKLHLRKRIQELEQEISRLTSELEERTRLEESLRQSEYHFRSMADGTPIMIWVTNAAGEIESVNQAYMQFFGVSLAQIQSIGWRMLIHPDDQMRYTEEYLFCHQQQKPFHAQGRIYRNDGTWRWIESYAQPRFSESGDYLGMAGSSIDVTDRIEAEEALHASELQFRKAFENAALGFTIAAPDGRFVDMNEAYCRLTGYSRTELLGLDEFQLIHPSDVERNRQHLGQLVTNGAQSFVIENRYVCKDGQLVWVRKSVSAIFSPNREPQSILSLVEQLPGKGRHSARGVRNAPKHLKNPARKNL